MQIITKTETTRASVAKDICYLQEYYTAQVEWKYSTNQKLNVHEYCKIQQWSEVKYFIPEQQINHLNVLQMKSTFSNSRLQNPNYRIFGDLGKVWLKTNSQSSSLHYLEL